MQDGARARRRGAGVYYTPAEIVAEVVGETLSGRLARAAWRGDGSPVLRVLDPAAGDGRFLVECRERLVDAAVARGFAAEEARRAVVARCLTGVERDPAAAAAARAALGAGADVRVGEALFGGLVADGAWDVVVGNPPWVRSVRLKAADPALWRRLRGAFAATSHGEWDLYGAFLERALSWAAGDGEIGMVVPSRWLTAAFAAPLRALLAGAARKIVDFGARQLFAEATTYTALVYLRPGGGTIAGLGAAPWILSSEPALAELRRSGPPLGSVARIAKGAGSNADPVFLLECRGDSMYSRALGESVDIEREALVPCLRGRDIGRHTAQVRRLALLPYRGGALIPWAGFPWPRAAAYLERCRALLEAREGGRFTGERFHAWGRPQNLTWLLDPTPKIVIPDAAREGRAALDTAGTLVIDTAYAIRPTGGVPISRLLELLNSNVVATWLRATGIPLRGGYFRMKTAYLSSLPVPGAETL